MDYIIENQNISDLFSDISAYDSEISIEEAMTGIIYEAEVNYSNLMKTVGIAELSCMETEGDVIYEAVDIKAFFKKIGEFFKNIFNKIVALFKKIAIAIDEFFTSVSVKMFINSKKFNSLKSVPKGFKYTGYKFTTANDYTAGCTSPEDCLNSTELFKDHVNLWDAHWNNSSSILYDSNLVKDRISWTSKANTPETREKTIYQMRCYIIDSDNQEQENNFNKLLFAIFRNNQTSPSEITEKDIDISLYKKTLQEGYTKLKKNINDNIKQAKDNVNKCIKELNNKLDDVDNAKGGKPKPYAHLVHSPKKQDGNGDTFYGIAAKLINAKVFYLKQYITDVTSLQIAHTKALLDETKQYKMALTKMMNETSSDNNENKSETQKESFGYANNILDAVIFE